MNYQYNIGCSLANLKGIRDFIRKALHENHVPEMQVSAIVLALDEMCSNLMIHAHHCDPNHQLELKIDHPSKNEFIFEIVDDGSVFDINRFVEPAMENLVQEKRKGGLGIRLVKSIMDRIEYRKEAGKSICRLTKTI
ncbi:MAG: ATP-binding protein [Bacteroidetes bacterium]|nr:ATP-binding protein [Bacteroidota bacterium]MBS1539112.1 ATP-binding protein [Bacteroidota bacterium]